MEYLAIFISILAVCAAVMGVFAIRESLLKRRYKHNYDVRSDIPTKEQKKQIEDALIEIMSKKIGEKIK